MVIIVVLFIEPINFTNVLENTLGPTSWNFVISGRKSPFTICLVCQCTPRETIYSSVFSVVLH